MFDKLIGVQTSEVSLAWMKGQNKGDSEWKDTEEIHQKCESSMWGLKKLGALSGNNMRSHWKYFSTEMQGDD